MSMHLTHPQNVFKKQEKVNMSDDFVGRMSHFHSRNGLLDREKLTDRIEKLEAALRDVIDNHFDSSRVCEIARTALEGKDG